MPGAPVSRLGDWLLPTWPAARLGLLRFAVGAYVLQDLLRVRRAIIHVGRTDPAMWDPVGVTSWLSGPLDPAVWASVYDLTIVGAVLFTLGLAWRVTGPSFAALLLFTWTYRVSWQMIYHVHHLTMIHVLILGAAPGAAASMSLDRLWSRRRGTAAAGDSWVFGWPVRLVCIATAISYLLAGIAKVNKAGWGWADGHNLLHQIAYDGVYKAVIAHPSDEPYPIIAFAFAHPWVMAPLAVFALVTEIGAPIALVHRRVGEVWAVLTLGMHWGIHAFMNLVFPYHMFAIAFLSFFELERLVPARLRARSAVAAPDRLRTSAEPSAVPPDTAAGT
ncbi:MAG: HTTM domain-containing protein [Deltaproteobacteria bacterium]|nr:HTTM domain-containing protein [Deltaproteobacteria bacterium]